MSEIKNLTKKVNRKIIEELFDYAEKTNADPADYIEEAIKDFLVKVKSQTNEVEDPKAIDDTLDELCKSLENI